MKLQFAIENNNMPQKAERSSEATYKCCRTKRWQAAILAFYTILLHATIAVMANATATMTTAATTHKVLPRSLQVANNGNAIILCKATDLSNTWFYDETGENVTQLLNVKDEVLKPFRVLFLRGITINSTYLCKEGDRILSRTRIKIADPRLTTPRRVEIAGGDDAALVFLHSGAKNITFRQTPFSKVNFKADNITIIRPDNGTAIMVIRNAIEGKSSLIFKHDHNMLTDETYFFVGHEPDPVEEFDCESQNYDYMTCKFSIPPNSLRVEYTSEYYIDKSEFKMDFAKKCQFEYNDSTAWITLTPSNNYICTYIPNATIYNFFLTGTNSLGSFRKKFMINNHEHVVPAKLNINISDKTDHSAKLTLDGTNKEFYRGVNYTINVRPKGWKNFTIFAYSEKLKYEYIFENLTFANWIYDVEVSARVKNFYKTKWNDPATVSFVTEPRRPDRAPRTFPGGFYKPNDNNNNNMTTLYWEELARNETNGENFAYIVRDLSTSSNDWKTTNSSFHLHLSDEAKIFSIYAENDVGRSETGNTIQVKHNEIKPQYIEKLAVKGGFKILWKFPNDMPKPSNYTIFWCKPRFASKTECKGAMSFKVVDSKQADDFIGTNEPLIMAVAANYPSNSTGLLWTTCSANLAENLDHEIVLEVKSQTAKEIDLKWNDKYCVNAFNKYNITYCEVRDKANLNCQHIIRESKEEKKLTLKYLKPYTNYNISIQAFAEGGKKSPEKLITCQTNEAAPEPPGNVDYVRGSITSTSVNISWEAPLVTNGVLQKYTIKYKMVNETSEREKTILAGVALSGEIEELNSDSTYEIYVIAWTTKSSKASKSIRITTLVGIPSPPANFKLKEDGDGYIINWTLPATRAGRVDLYELIFIQNEKKKILTVKRTSDSPQTCRLKFPYCTEGTQTMEVRAINLVTKAHLDTKRFRIAKTGEVENLQRERRHSDPSYPTSLVYTQATTSSNEKGNPNDTTPKESTTPPSHMQKQLIEVYPYKAYKDFECVFSPDPSKHVPDDDIYKDYYMLSSEPKQNTTQYLCPHLPWEYMLAIGIFFTMAIISLIWGYRKIHEKRNINVILPDSILQLMSMSIKLPTDIEIGKADNISIVSIKTNDSKSLINKDCNHINRQSSASSSGESGVGGIGGDDSVSPSTSSEDVNGELTRDWSQDEPASPQTTTTLNSLSHSLPDHQRSTPALQCRNQGITINDDYLLVEQITNNKLLPIMDDKSISSGSSYIKSGSSSASECGTGNVINAGNYIAVGDIVGTAKDNANTAILKNHSKPVFIQAKSSPTHPNIIKNVPITTGDYVLPDSLVRLSASNYAHMEPARPNLLKTGDYVLPDALSRITSSHKSMMNEVNKKPVKTFQTQFFPTGTSGAAQPNISKNPTIATGDYVSPESLPKIAATFSNREENQNSKKTFQKQALNDKTALIQPNHFRNVTLATGDYVTPDALPKIAASFSLKAENEKSQNLLEKPHLNDATSLCKNLTFTTGDYVTPDALPMIAQAHAAAAATDHEDSKKPLQQQTKSPIVSYGYVTPDFWAQQQSVMK
uniref:Cytokine receptor n=2 Tax=Ceratitis capitata TaxID=7213 RepID=W8AST6_CERCA